MDAARKTRNIEASLPASIVIMPSRIPRIIAPSLQGRLSLFLIAVLCLGASLAGWLIWQGYRNERRAMEKHLSDTASALATLMDTEISKREALLQGLAVSTDLASGNLRVFHEQARRALPDPDEWIVLTDEHHQQLVNTRVDYDTPLPLVERPAEFDRAMREGRSYISNLEISPVSGLGVLYLTLPVFTADEQPQTLSFVSTPSVFTNSLLRHQIGEGWLTAVVDRTLTIAGRSRNGEEFVGGKASERMNQLISEQQRGVSETVTLDGVRSITAFYRSPTSGWTVIVAAPRSELFAGASQLAMQALVLAIVAGVLAIFFALWIGRSVVAGVDALVNATQTLARGEKLQAGQTGIDEIDFVSQALAATSETLAAREAALAHARDEAVAASRAKDEFLASLSHELRTPLNPALLLASDGARDPDHPPAVREIFGTISRHVSIEARLIDDLLDLTRIGSGKLSLHIRPLVLDRLLQEITETLRRQIEEKPLTLSLDLNSGGAATMGDPTRLQQVFWNLLNNAVKFTPAHGALTLSSRLDATAGQIVVTVSDTGLGMNAGEIQRLFKRFVQGDHAAQGGQSAYGGLGLGLVIARELIDLHHGKIDAASAGRGQGSTFTVRLPLCDRTHATRIETPGTNSLPPAGSGTGSPGTSGKKILLVEDHKPTLTTLEKLLQRRGHAVTSAGTAATALACADAGQFDLVISDIGLPDKTGYELMRELSERHGLKGIAMSGYGAESDRAQGRAAGFLHHLTKPVNIASLEEALRGVFDPSSS
jgi:signal transduction histidine kinase